MKILNVLLLACFIPVLGMAQDKEAESNEYTYKVLDFFLGLNSGVDYNVNAFRSVSTSDFSFEDKGPRYNISFDASVMATKRLRPRIELQYHRLAYGQEWLGASSSSYTTMEYTTTRVNYFGLNFHLDYLLMGLNSRFKIFLSPGLNTEYSTGVSYKTLKTDGDETSSRFSSLGDYYPKSIAGLNLTAIMKYDLSENLGITLSPGYTHYLRPFMEVNDNSYQRFNLNLGVELRIHKNDNCNGKQLI